MDKTNEHIELKIEGSNTIDILNLNARLFYSSQSPSKLVIA